MGRAFSTWTAFLSVLLAALSLCFAQKPTVIPLVPAANWRQVDSQNRGVDEVRNYGGDPAIEREYGVKFLELRTYQLSNTRAEVLVEPASDATAAYGLLTCYITESMLPEKQIQLAFSYPDGALVARGRNFIRFLRGKDSRLSDNDFRALLIFVGGTRPSSDALANLPVLMPTSGLLPGTGKYVLGPESARRALPSFRTGLFGFDQGAEVQMGDYQEGKVRSTVIAISYPTPQIARVRFGAMTDFLGINQHRGASPLYGRREGSFIFLVLNADAATTAAKLMDQFKVAQGVSWDRPYPGDKPFTLQVVELLLANFALILILLGIAVVGGLLVFVSKRVAARFFPDWDWGQPDAEILIRLNLR